MTHAAADPAPFSADELQAIQAQTEALLCTQGWRQAPRQRRLLQHIVQASLAGDARQLRGEALGRNVFDRGPDFDPTIDPIVRVEVGRLRSKLLAHYAGEGANDPVRIDVPKGAYVATFAIRERAAARVPLAQGIGRFWLLTDDGLQQAQQSFADTLARDPGYAAAHAWLAVAAVNRHAFAFDRGTGSIRLARHHAAQAVALEPHSALVHAAQCAVLAWSGEADQALQAGRRAVALDPNFADAHALLALALADLMQLPQALNQIDLAMQLGPGPSGYYYWIKGMTLQWLGRDDLARDTYMQGLAAAAPDPFSHVGLALCHLRQGDEAQAHAQMQHFRAGFPHADLVYRNRYREPRVRAAYSAALARLGFVALPA